MLFILYYWRDVYVCASVWSVHLALTQCILDLNHNSEQPSYRRDGHT